MELVCRQRKLPSGFDVPRLCWLIEVAGCLTHEAHPLSDQEPSLFGFIREVGQIVTIGRPSELRVFDPLKPQIRFEKQLDGVEIEEAHRRFIEATGRLRRGFQSGGVMQVGMGKIEPYQLGFVDPISFGHNLEPQDRI